MIWFKCIINSTYDENVFEIKSLHNSWRYEKFIRLKVDVYCAKGPTTLNGFTCIVYWDDAFS